MLNDVTDTDTEYKDPADINEAFLELRSPAFATWIRLHVIDPVHLKGGVSHVARVLGIAREALLRHLEKLVDVGYIRLIRPGGGSLSTIIITRRAMIVRRPDLFVLL